MTLEEVIGGVIELLRQHKDGLRGNLQQEPYKGDFFKLFATAFNKSLRGQNDYLTGDALRDVVVSRAPEVVDDKVLENLSSLWREWSYAWERRSEIQK
jgi:hypothetical protein